MVLFFVWFVCFVLLIWKLPFFKLQDIPRWVLLVVFVAKLAASTVLHYMYTQYYPDRATADIFKYFDDAVVLFASIHESVGDFLKILLGINCETPEMFHYFQDTNHWSRMYEYTPFLDNRLIIRMNMLILLVSGGHIAVHYLFANFISFVGFVLIYKTFERFYGKQIFLFVLIFLMPSSLLWTAGILKECLTTLALGAFVFGFFSLLQDRSFPSFFLCIVGLLTLVILKFFILVALLPAIVAYCLVELLDIRRPWWFYGVICLGGLLFIAVLDFGLHVLPFFESFVGKRTDFINVAIITNAQSVLPMEKITATPFNVLRETPIALWNVFALPYLWNCGGIVQFVPALESILFFVLLVLMICFPKEIENKNRNFLWFCICFSLALAWEIGISTPIIGGIVRYKIPIFPFLYTTFAMLINWKTLIHRFKRH